MVEVPPVNNTVRTNKGEYFVHGFACYFGVEFGKKKKKKHI